MSMSTNFGQLIKQAQKMQKQMQSAQEELSKMHVTGSGGGGMIKITMTGRYEVTKIEIDDGLLEEDKEFIGDIIAAAINDASRKVESSLQSKMASLASNISLPKDLEKMFGKEEEDKE